MLLDLLQTHIWALDTRYYQMAKSVIMARLEQGLPALDESLVQPRRMRTYFEGNDVLLLVPGAYEDREETKPEARVAYRTAQVAGSSAGQVAVIPIMGTMTKRSDYCATGTSEIGAAIEQAYIDPNVSAIVLHMDSGGGDVDGTEALGNIIAQQRKPIVAYVDGLSASANYWTASQTNHIMLSSKVTAYVGSIGVLAMPVDQSAFLEKQGVKVTILRSSKATDKARMNSVEPLTEELLADYTAQLNSIHDHFIFTVKNGRTKVLGNTKKLDDSLFTGRIYNGKESLKNGLADSIGTLSDAIRKADSLAHQKQRGGATQANNQSTTPMMKNLLALVQGKPAVTAEEQPAVEEQEQVSEEELAQADEQIGALRIRVVDQERQIAALSTTLAERDQALATATARVTELEASNTTLAAENTQLNTWKKSNQAFLAKPEDESNRAEGTPNPKASWEIHAEQLKEKAHKRSK